MSVFNKKQPPPIVEKLQSQMAEMQAPVRRPLLEKIRAARQQKEIEQRDTHARLQRLMLEIQAIRHEEAWLILNPEFDAIFNRLSEKPDASIRPSGQ